MLYAMRTTSLYRAVSSAQSAFGASAVRMVASNPNKALRVTLVDGDGIGPEITSSVVGVFNAANVPIHWDQFSKVETNDDVDDLIISLSRNRVGIKGPLHTSTGKGQVSRNLRIRKALDLFANVVPFKPVPGIKTRHDNVDFVVIRENTEGEYSGLEHEVAPGIVQSSKVITTEGSLRIANFAFEYAKTNGRKKVTAVHKANIQKLSDGEFLRCCRSIAEDYPDIEYNEMIVDNCSMQLALRPEQFDVMITPNLYGTIIQNIGAGLIGGPGILPGRNVGYYGILFESGARHVGMDIGGKNTANPTGMLLSGVDMLRHLQLYRHAELVESAIMRVLENREVVTPDLGGTGTTKQFTKAVIDNIERLKELDRKKQQEKQA